MGVSRSSYYDWRNHGETSKGASEGEEVLKERLKALFKGSRSTYGSRRLVQAMGEAQMPIGRFKVRRLMQELGLEARYPKKYRVTTDSTHKLGMSENILGRQFNRCSPNRAWVTDLTYIWTLEGFVYLATVMDLYSRQIVGWAIDDTMKTSLCINALRMAYWRKKPEPGLLHHSDRGSQYASHAYRELLKSMGMEQSMSRKGNCWDNSPKERFFRSLKSEHLNYERLVTKGMAKLSIVDYIAFYNGQRIHSTLGYKTPLAFEREFYQKAA